MSNSPHDSTAGPRRRYGRACLGLPDQLLADGLSDTAISVLFFAIFSRARGVLPGVLAYGRAGLAEAMGRPVDAIIAAIEELGDRLIVDPARPLMFAPLAMQHDPPANPNVVTSWARAYLELPRSIVRDAVDRELRVLLSPALRESWTRATEHRAEAVEAGAQNRSRNGSVNGSLNGIEQVSAPIPSPTPTPTPSPTPAPAPAAVAAMSEGFEELVKAYPKRPYDVAEARTAYREHVTSERDHRFVMAVVAEALASESWQQERGRFVPQLAKFLSTWRTLEARCPDCREHHRGADACLPLCSDCRCRHDARMRCGPRQMREAAEAEEPSIQAAMQEHGLDREAAIAYLRDKGLQALRDGWSAVERSIEARKAAAS